MACLAWVCACAQARPTHTQVITPYDAMMARYQQSLSRAIPAIMSRLAEADVRLAARADATLVAEQGDPFDLSSREGAIEEAEDTLAGVEAHPTSKYAADPRMIEVLLDQQTLHDLLAAELARLRREANESRAKPPAPRGAIVDLVPGAIAFADAGHVQDPDTHLAWRLQQVLAELKPNTLSVFQRDELTATLRSASRRGPKTAAEASALLKLLERVPVSPYPLLSEVDLEDEVEAFLGVPTVAGDPQEEIGTPRLDKVQPMLERGAALVRAQLDAALSVLSPRARADAQRRAVALFSRLPSCTNAERPSSPRQMDPPDERARACSIVRAVASSASDLEEVSALMVMNEAIITAGRSRAMHERTRDPRVAEQRWPRALPLDASVEERELWLAANHPTKAIAGGLAVILLVDAGAGRARGRAREWARYGDARFDVIERHLIVTNAR